MDEKTDDSLPCGENADAETDETVQPVDKETDLEEQEQNMDIEAPIESAGTDTNAEVQEAADSADAEKEASIPDPEPENITEKSVDADAQLDETPTNAEETDPICDTITEETGDHSSSTDTAATDSVVSTPAPATDAMISSDALASALTESFGVKETENVEQTDTKDSLETKTSSAIYSLEEELERMHEDDPPEKTAKPQIQPSTDLITEDKKSEPEEKLVDPVEKITKPIIRIAEQVRVAERNIRPAEKTYRGARSLEKKVATPVLKMPDSPILKDSDLEEILGAEEVVKDPVLIKDAQEEIKTTDVLVCGKCYDSFLFVEEFQKHKLKPCQTKLGAWPIGETETKPQIWGFKLWKSRQMKSTGPIAGKLSDWKLYQNWCSLAETDKNAWIAAGQSLQYCNKIGTGKLTEVRQILQSTKTPVKEEKDPLALDGFESNKENATITVGRKPIIEIKKPLIRSVRVVKDTVPVATPSPKIDPKADPNVNRATRTLRSTDKGERGEFAVERIVAKRFNPKKKVWEYQIKWEHFPSNDNTWEPMENLNHCKQMVEDFEQQLTKLKSEKAQQQAANLVRNRPKILNTQAGLASPGSSSVVDTPNRPQRTSKQKALNQVKAWCGTISDEEKAPAGGVKRARSPDSDDSFEKRMKFEDFDDSDSDAGPPSPTPPTPPKLQYKKIAPKPTVQIVKNGLGQVGSLPPNVLIPDANGVVRINQKQLPSLSAGVYIMSKTAGIIKLDSNTSKVATSGGQTIVKVAPKIGQTQIKIVKKDGSTTKQIVQMSPQNVRLSPGAAAPVVGRPKKQPINVRPMAAKRTAEAARKAAPEARKTVVAVKGDGDKRAGTPVAVKRLLEGTTKITLKGGKMREEGRRPAQLIHEEPPKRADEESDDGLEELPFPEEIKIPEPDSPEDDFFLDPSTGKIAGQDYPDPEPEPEPMEETKSDTSLDNIVKLAAADITEEDLKNEPTDGGMEAEQMAPPAMEEDEEEEMVVEKVKMPIRTAPIRKIITASPTRTIVRMPMGAKKTPATIGSPLSASSILNKALTGQQVVRRSVLSTTPKMVHQRILNPTVGRAGAQTVGSPVVRSTGSFMRARPRGGVTISPKIVRAQTTVSPRNVYSYTKSPIQTGPRKIGNTIIRTTSTPIIQHQHQQLQQVQRVQPRAQPRIVQQQQQQGGMVQRTFMQKKEPMIIRGQPEMIEPRKIVAAKPKKVISMPSLIGDDDLLLVPKPASQPPKSPTQLTAPAAESPQEDPLSIEPSAESDGPSSTKTEADDGGGAQEQQQQASPEEGAGLAPDMSTFTLADNENPIFITGDDGTVYQVAGQNEQGQTILLTQGSDGQQQCLLVTNEVAEAMDTTPVEEPQQPVDIAIPEISPDVTEPLSVKTDVSEGGDQVVAQVVRAEPPSPGGTHKVVVMLPDGNLMVTQVSPEEYASLELE